MSNFSLETTGTDEAWSLIDCTKMLIYAAELLLDRYNYDGSKHEEILYAKRQAEKYLAEIVEIKKLPNTQNEH
jgi:hypothetical protein